MKIPADPRVVERVRTFVARRLGLDLHENRLDELAELLLRRSEMARETPVQYADRLERLAPSVELHAIAEVLTVGETYFFRNGEQFRAFVEEVLPGRMHARRHVRRLRLLSAGCSSGDEAYSLAIAMCECDAAADWDVGITAADINPAALARAKAGRYGKWALRETDASRCGRWFQAAGQEYLLDPAVRGRVRFEQRNLVEDDPGLWMPESYDAIFCRNVLMYLTPAGARAMVAHVTRALAPGGYLFLGHAETLRGLSQDYELRHTHGTFYYRRRDDVTAEGVDSGPNAELDPARGPDATGLEGWMETIQRSASRIEELAQGQAPSPPSLAAARGQSGPALQHAVELLRRERYADALDALGAGDATDAESLLLRAVLLTHAGQLEAAEQVCGELRAIDDLNPGTHHVLSLCREAAGDRAGAAEHDRVAAYLDPDFAMPHLHLGLMARRAGDLEVARRALARACDLLAREDASRILLFGGGFSRRALIQLCDAELRAAGAAP